MATALFTCFAIAAPGLEQLLARELVALGETPRVDEGGVTWEGGMRSVMRANLWLRTASRVLVRVARFKATAFYELENRAKKIPWAEFMGPGRDVDFRVTSRKSRLYHSDAIAERLDKGVRSVVAGLANAAPDVTPQTPHLKPSTQLFVVRVHRDEFTISADTSGELLHMRGYRQEVGKAPLRETLAAALLLASDWRGKSPLIDPFCGSGTIPIEAALLARGIPPGLHRRFGLMDWPSYKDSEWQSLVDEARTAALASSPVPILGSDRDAGAIEAARANAERAGVASDVELAVRAVSGIVAPRPPGLVATNPPYGVRVSGKTDLRDLYAQLGHVARRELTGWRVALYSPDPRLTREVGLPFREVLRTSNGGIKVSGLLADVSSTAME